MPEQPADKSVRQHGARFATTRWSVVLEAGRGSGKRSREALARLCETYWYPLYSYTRRWGHDADKAQELTQEFFTRLIEKQDLGKVDPARGRFRSFLLAAMKHFLLNERDREQAAKRNYGQAPMPMEFETAEGRFRLEPADHATPERAFERQWALTVLDRTLHRLRTEHEKAGKGAQFEHLKDALTGEKSASYAQLAAKIQMTEGAVKVAVHRMRRRFGELLREEIAETVADPQEVDDEIRYLFAVLEPPM
jgi:RNA polymerase sigma factor (sigma-70 family)